MLTKIGLANRTSEDVTVFLTLGATPGCLQDVSKVPWIKNVLNSLQGSFILPQHSSIAAFAPKDMGFNGNLSFGTTPQNCPTPSFPKGVNLFEFIVNNAFQGANAQETVNISCVAGINAWIAAMLCEILEDHGGKGATLPWNAGPGYPDVGHFENGPFGTNTGRVGVFPVGCDDCTASVSPPQCANKLPYEKPQSEAICTVQRNASGSGGLVIVEYYGKL